MKLYTHNYNGNLHEVCTMINERMPDLVESLIHLESVSGSLSIAVFRVSDDRYKELTKHWVR